MFEVTRHAAGNFGHVYFAIPIMKCDFFLLCPLGDDRVVWELCRFVTANFANYVVVFFLFFSHMRRKILMHKHKEKILLLLIVLPKIIIYKKIYFLWSRENVHDEVKHHVLKKKET